MTTASATGFCVFASMIWPDSPPVVGARAGVASRTLAAPAAMRPNSLRNRMLPPEKYCQKPVAKCSSGIAPLPQFGSRHREGALQLGLLLSPATPAHTVSAALIGQLCRISQAAPPA